jgi:hypothetical protein
MANVFTTAATAAAMSVGTTSSAVGTPAPGVSPPGLRRAFPGKDCSRAVKPFGRAWAARHHCMMMPPSIIRS